MVAVSTGVLAAWMCAAGVAAAAALAPHPGVLAARRQEELLPAHQRSRALHNPRLLQALHYSSALHAGERPVYERDSDRIPRQEIFSVLAHAGFLPRAGRVAAPPPPRRPHRHHLPPPPPPSPYSLQYL